MSSLAKYEVAKAGSSRSVTILGDVSDLLLDHKNSGIRPLNPARAE
jgi:hypothetical protein